MDRRGSWRTSLAGFSGGEPIQARAVTSVERGWRWCRRKPALASLAAAATLLLLAILIGFPIAFLRIKQSRKRAEAGELTALLNLKRAEAGECTSLGSLGT